MFLEESLIRFVYKDFDSPDQLNLDAINSLSSEFDESNAECAFCNNGDFDLDDLKEYMPEDWGLEVKEKLAMGQFRLAVAQILYGSCQLKFNTDVSKIALEAIDLCGVYPLTCSNPDDDEKVFGDSFKAPSGGNKLLLFSYAYKDVIDKDTGEVPTENDETVLSISSSEMQEKLAEWKEIMETSMTQEEYDQIQQRLRFL